MEPDALFCSRCGSPLRREGQRPALPDSGTPLDRLLGERGPLPIPQVESILRQVAERLARLHRGPSPQVHGGVEPRSIQLHEDGGVTLAVPQIRPGERWEGDDMSMVPVLENPEYMSPEECRGVAPSAGSDQYALGAVAYAMLAGRPPFVGASYKVLVAHLSEAFVPLVRWRPDCPPRLASAVERMLAKDPAHRWPGVSEAVEAALEEWWAPWLPPRGVLRPLPVALPAPSPPMGALAPPESPDMVEETGGISDEVADRGPDLGPAPRGIAPVDEPEETDEEDEPGVQDREALFFEPIPPPPALEEDDLPEDGVTVEGETPAAPGLVVPTAPPGAAPPPVEAAPPAAPTAPLPPAATPPPPRRGPPPRTPRVRRRRRTVLLLLVLLAGAAGWGTWEIVGGSDEADEIAWEWPGGGPPPTVPADDGYDPGGPLLSPPETGGAPPDVGVDPAPAPPDTTSRPSPAPGSGSLAPPDPAETLPPPGSSTPPPPPPAERSPEEPAPAQPGSLELNIRPWAHLLVNGVPRGRFQTSLQLDLPPGTHFVRMSNPNFPPFDTTVVVTEGETIVVNKILQPDPEP